MEPRRAFRGGALAAPPPAPRRDTRSNARDDPSLQRGDRYAQHRRRRLSPYDHDCVATGGGGASGGLSGGDRAVRDPRRAARLTARQARLAARLLAARPAVLSRCAARLARTGYRPAAILKNPSVRPELVERLPYFVGRKCRASTGSTRTEERWRP